MSQSLFSQPLNVINVGIAMFSDDLKKQHVEVTQLDWTPPGQGNMQVVQALDNIADSPLADKIAAANQQALERIIQSHPVLIGFDQAINVVPGMTPKTILHAGPPITWEKMCGAMKGAVTGALVFEGLAKDLDLIHQPLRNNRMVVINDIQLDILYFHIHGPRHQQHDHTGKDKNQSRQERIA